jgi:hypothetical protein
MISFYKVFSLKNNPSVEYVFMGGKWSKRKVDSKDGFIKVEDKYQDYLSKQFKTNIPLWSISSPVKIIGGVIVGLVLVNYFFKVKDTESYLK